MIIDWLAALNLTLEGILKGAGFLIGFAILYLVVDWMSTRAKRVAEKAGSLTTEQVEILTRGMICTFGDLVEVEFELTIDDRAIRERYAKYLNEKLKLSYGLNNDPGAKTVVKGFYFSKAGVKFRESKDSENSKKVIAAFMRK